MDITQIHGSARRVPAPSDDTWGSFTAWLGLGGKVERDAESGELAVTTQAGRVTAHPGDWLIRTMAGELHLGRGEPAR